MGGLIIGVILVLIGISAITGVHLLNFIFAVVLVAVGVRLIIRHSGPNNQWRHQDHFSRHFGGANTSHENTLNEVIVFSALNKTVISENFTGGKIAMVFAGGELDLTEVKTTRTELDLEISSVFSSIEIMIPKEWKVRVNAKAVLGNVDTHAAQGGEGNVTLVIMGEAVFGEIEVRNR